MADLETTARRVGCYVWAESTLFTVLGGWVPSVQEVDVTVHLGAHCGHHAGHADLWRRRLPVVPHLDVVELTSGDGRRVRLAEELARPDSTIERLAGVYRVFLPRLIAAYTEHEAVAAGTADGPTSRVLRFALLDAIDDWRHGERLLQSLIRTPGDTDLAAIRQRQLETLLVEAGGLTTDLDP